MLLLNWYILTNCNVCLFCILPIAVLPPSSYYLCQMCFDINKGLIKNGLINDIQQLSYTITILRNIATQDGPFKGEQTDYPFVCIFKC